MKVAKIETLSCDAGWRNYHFVKLTTDTGVIGWSEFDEGFGAPGVGAVIARLSTRVIGQEVGEHERIYAELHSATRPGFRRRRGAGQGAIENALLDAKAKELGVPVYELLGGKIRDRIRVYWSHCATWRINHPTHYKPAITDLDGVKAIGREVREKGFAALKTNIFNYDRTGRTAGMAAGFRRAVHPGLNVDRDVLRNLRMHLEALRDGAGPNVGYPARSQLQRQDRGLSQDPAHHRRHRHVLGRDRQLLPEALGYIRRQSPHPISSCETLLGLREFLPYFREQAMDVAIVDTPWNGVWQSMKIAAAAEAHEVNVAPHNFYGHLCTMMNAHFAAAVPNLRIMETDIDRIAWDHELFSHVPEFVDGHLIMPNRPGLGHRTERGSNPGAPAEGREGVAGLRPQGMSRTPSPLPACGERVRVRGCSSFNVPCVAAPHPTLSPR